MASIKPVLLKSKMKPDGTCPLMIRIIQDRRPRYISLGKYVLPEHWDMKSNTAKSSAPNSGMLNYFISTKITEANGLVVKSEQENQGYNSVQLKNVIKNKSEMTFAQMAQLHLDEKKAMGKFNQLITERSRVKIFKEFLPGGDVSFQNITQGLLKQFMIYLKTKKGVEERTVMNYLVVIRTVFNKAIDLELVDRKYYPFGRKKIVIKFQEGTKIGLNAEEVRLLENCELEVNTDAWHARNIWLCSFYLAGIRVGDAVALKWADFIDGRIFYIMGKNKKLVSFKVPEKVENIIKLYALGKKNSPFVFPYLVKSDLDDQEVLQKHARSANCKINDNLELIAESLGIEKKLTMHISRHTFGNLAGDKIPPQLLQKLYRHTDLKTTLGYQSNFIHRDVDDALEKVLDF